MAAMKRAMLLVLSASALWGCKGGVRAAVSTDHAAEEGGRGIADMQVSTEVSGEDITIKFAPASADWKDPRPQRIQAGTPPPWIAAAGCVIKAKQGKPGETNIQPGQTCTGEGKTLTVDRGSVWIKDDVLNVDLYGKLDNGREYKLQYPFGIVDPALKAK
jgi:hypothetical protein